MGETLERILGGLLQRLSTEGLDIPLLNARTAETVGLLVITGDRGLCGGYNSNAIKKAEERIAELKAQGVKVELICVGNKGGRRTSRFLLCRRTRPCRAPLHIVCINDYLYPVGSHYHPAVALWP